MGVPAELLRGLKELSRFGTIRSAVYSVKALLGQMKTSYIKRLAAETIS